jgi:hypothetical protein
MAICLTLAGLGIAYVGAALHSTWTMAGALVMLGAGAMLKLFAQAGFRKYLANQSGVRPVGPIQTPIEMKPGILPPGAVPLSFASPATSSDRPE